MEQYEGCLTSNQRKSWTQGFLQMKRLQDKMMTHHNFPFPSQTVQSIRGKLSMPQEDRETQNPAAQWNAIIVSKDTKLLKESQRKDSLEIHFKNHNIITFDLLTNLLVENWKRCNNYISIIYYDFIVTVIIMLNCSSSRPVSLKGFVNVN